MPLTEFGPVQHLSADAVGQPGQRRFRLRAISEGGSYAFVWMEKEQLSAIGEAIETTLEHAGAPPPAPTAGEPDPVFPFRRTSTLMFVPDASPSAERGDAPHRHRRRGSPLGGRGRGHLRRI